MTAQEAALAAAFCDTQHGHTGPFLERPCRVAREAAVLMAAHLAAHPPAPDHTAALRAALERLASAHHARHEGHVPFNPDVSGFRGCPVVICQYVTETLAAAAQPDPDWCPYQGVVIGHVHGPKCIPAQPDPAAEGVGE